VSAPSDYSYLHLITLRWKDNDVYGHVNNVEYYSFFDTVINAYLIREAGLDIDAGPTIGLCAESHCVFRAPAAFPDTVTAGMRVVHLGTSSVRYELALFDSHDEQIADGWFVHVFVDRQTRRPSPIPPAMRTKLEEISV
jgi:acyl-CoA thioester hydrolase